MKQVFFLILLSLGAPLFGGVTEAMLRVVAGVDTEPEEPGSYLLEYDFEEAGFPAGVSQTAATALADATDLVLAGSESGKIAGNGVMRIELAGQTDVWIYFRSLLKANATTTRTLLSVRDAGGAELSRIWRNGNKAGITATGSSPGDSAFDALVDTEYHYFFHYTASGNCELFVSTDGVKVYSDSASAQYYVRSNSVANATSYLEVRNPGLTINVSYIDNIIVSNSVIPDNPSL